ncbi:MAG: UTP--glucose-1-phosphate uridylyltransferase, partial [Lentisphaeria bacterium]
EIPLDLKPAQYYPIDPETQDQVDLYMQAYELGKKMIAEGKVALCTVAGGQGTRLGFDGPKGSYLTSPIMSKSLFQLFAEQIIGLQKLYNVELKWYIMTSRINNVATELFFQENNYFGLKSDNVFFFVQGLMPVFNHQGKILMAAKDDLQMSPDGHGGTLLAMRKSGALQQMIDNNIEHLSYFQVDNPLVSVIDPLFVGLHSLTNSEVSSRSLTKTGPFEKLGNFCITNNKLTIIEYSDMPDELATATDASDRLAYRAGSPAIHVFSRKFIERITEGGSFSLPFHRADKKVPFIDENGSLIEPTENNAVKLETFIFDTIPMAQNPIILEAVREEQFAPVKNATGVDSAESCREMSMLKDALWLEQAGFEVPRNDDGSLNCRI